MSTSREKSEGKAHSLTALIPSTGDSSTVFVLTADSMASSSPPLLLKMLLLLFLIDLFASKRKELLALTGISSVFLLPLDSHYVMSLAFLFMKWNVG